MNGGDQWGGVDRGAEREGILEEEEVGDVGEVWLAGVDEALKDAEVDEGGGFERGCDGFRIPRSSSADGALRSCAVFFLKDSIPVSCRTGPLGAERQLRCGQRPSAGRFRWSRMNFVHDQREGHAKP